MHTSDKSTLMRRYHTLVKQAALSEDERLAILDGAGVETSKDLSIEHLQTICDKLQCQVNNRFNAPPEVRRLRSAVIIWMEKHGYYQNGGSWDKVNKFLESPRICGKRLYALSLEELKSLMAKLATIGAKKLEQTLENNTKSKWN